ncbi:MAG: hypothetical protein RLZZ500_132 [Bacteroidota bacterium]|jgi:mannobiose 2-epimerase
MKRDKKIAFDTQKFKAEIHTEMQALLSYWSQETPDEFHGGFIGEIDDENHKNYFADKGAVLNARLLWTFAAAYPITKNEAHKKLAERAFLYLKNHFYNTTHGGLFWSVTYNGQPKESKNQIYALAFAIYGLSEYYKISDNNQALAFALSLYYKIEAFSFDTTNGGYFEAFSQDWELLEDLRLSDKDANEKKTMNTHLHIVEAYANLYEVWPDKELKQRIKGLLNTIDTYFIDKNSGHLRLFFDENWNESKSVISYGHDIEAAWLLLRCAEIIEDDYYIDTFQANAQLLTTASLRGLDKDGALWYEWEITTEEMIYEKHWWPQAEFLIGMVNAYELTQDEKYLDQAYKNYEFIQQKLVDRTHGEWIWGIYADGAPIKKDKVGFWKCPYHNVRACIELINRL